MSTSPLSSLRDGCGNILHHINSELLNTTDEIKHSAKRIQQASEPVLAYIQSKSSLSEDEARIPIELANLNKLIENPETTKSELSSSIRSILGSVEHILDTSDGDSPTCAPGSRSSTEASPLEFDKRWSPPPLLERAASAAAVSTNPFPLSTLPQLKWALCDDEVPNLMIEARHLKASRATGAEKALQVKSAEELYDRLLSDDTSIDVLLLDIQMPGDNGLTVLDAIRNDPKFARHSEMTIIMVTANPELAVGHPHNGILKKPFTRQDLEAALVKAMPKHFH